MEDTKKLSPFDLVQAEVTQHARTRQKLIETLQGLLSQDQTTKVVSFFVSFSPDRAGFILDNDAEMLENLLAAEPPATRLVLVINAPGGVSMAAERIVNVCREYSKHNFEVMVPHMAKSAATMICFGARCIWMSRTAELGPVDPQWPYKDDRDNPMVISADEYIRSYEALFKSAVTSGPGAHIEPFLQQLNKYDARLVEQMRSAQKLSEDISIRALSSGQMKGKSPEEIRKAINVFLSQEMTRSHGRMIGFDEARTCGLQIKEIDLQSDVWNTLWELYVRSNWTVTRRCGKIIESASSAVSA